MSWHGKPVVRELETFFYIIPIIIAQEDAVSATLVTHKLLQAFVKMLKSVSPFSVEISRQNMA